MRNALRLLIPVLTAAVIVLGSGSSVLAAATPTKESLDANWCFTDVTRTYCFDVDGTVHYLDNSAGSSLTYTAITRTSFFEDGQYIGSSKSVETLRGVFANDGTVTMQTGIHTRSTVDGEDCVYHLVLRLADYEVVVDHVKSTCGG